MTSAPGRRSSSTQSLRLPWWSSASVSGRDPGVRRARRRSAPPWHRSSSGSKKRCCNNYSAGQKFMMIDMNTKLKTKIDPWKTVISFLNKMDVLFVHFWSTILNEMTLKTLKYVYLCKTESELQCFFFTKIVVALI